MFQKAINASGFSIVFLILFLGAGEGIFFCVSQYSNGNPSPLKRLGFLSPQIADSIEITIKTLEKANDEALKLGR